MAVDDRACVLCLGRSMIVCFPYAGGVLLLGWVLASFDLQYASLFSEQSV